MFDSEQIWAIVLILMILGGVIVGLVLAVVTKSYRRPSLIPEDKWANYTKGVDLLTGGSRWSGFLVGALERLFFFAAFWSEAHLLIPGWMAVKVATKWQVWSNFLQGTHLPDWSGPQNTLAKRYTLWRVSQRFLIGSLLNILLADFAYLFALEYW